MDPVQQQFEAFGRIPEATQGEAPSGQRTAGQGPPQRFRTERRLRARLQLGEEFLRMEKVNLRLGLQLEWLSSLVRDYKTRGLTTTELMQDMYS